MKKVVLLILLSTMIFPMMVSASEKKPYYTNLNGAELTEQQYNNLKKAFNDDTIATMTVETINLLKNEQNLSTTVEEKYIRTDEYYDDNGNLIDSIETEVTKSQADSFVENKENGVVTYDYPNHQTSMKRLSISIAVGSISVKTVTVTNTWLSIPSTKSYDVIAIRPGNLSGTININNGMISGYQKWDGNIINYNSSSENTKIVSSGLSQGQGGVGISMNIVDSVNSSLQNSITVTFISGANPFTAYGSYQHAQSNVTLAQSKDYSINSSGLGGVINFSSSVRGRYDAMQGVNRTWSL